MYLVVVRKFVTFEGEMRIRKTKSAYQIIQLLAGRSNVFLLTNGKTNILIDTSTKEHWKKLNRRIKSLKIKHIDYLILTHTHFDHAENAQRIKEEYRAKIIVHKSEAECLESGQNLNVSGTNFFTKTIVRLLRGMARKILSYEPCQADILTEDKYDLSALGFNAYIIHTPGHTKGSMSVVVDDEIAIVGDAMFGIFWWSVYPPFADDSMQVVESWGALLDTKSLVFLPSHGSARSRALLQKEFSCRRQRKE